jgi:ABC-type uncharacterized transport system permease subunit
MQIEIVLGLTAIAAIVPAAVWSWREGFQRNAMLWSVLAVAVAGPVAVLSQRAHGVWQADFASSIWVTVVVTMLAFFLSAVFIKHAWRLTPLVSIYMALFSVVGLAWQNVPIEPVPAASVSGWLLAHIALAVATYALATLAAVAALAAFLQERALKQKRRPILDGTLPSITDCDLLVRRFLLIGEVILGLGLMSGIAVNLVWGQEPLPIDHKTVFTMGAFITIGVVLIAQARWGLRGCRAARGVLLAYLLLTLGYPGVKFVSDVLLG